MRGVETYALSLTTSPESAELTTHSTIFPELIKKITRDEKIAESIQLVVDIHSALSQKLQLVSRRATNRGVKQAPLVVLIDAHMPAVLSEISFVVRSRTRSRALRKSSLLDHRDSIANR